MPHCITEAWIVDSLRRSIGVRPGSFIDVAIDAGQVWIVLWIGSFSSEAIIPVASIQRFPDPRKFMERVAEEVDIATWN